MILIKALVTAGPNHPSYTEGLEMQANVFVDSDNWSEAESKALRRLGELGWESTMVKDSMHIPDGSDLSHLKANLVEAWNLAKELGVSLIVYPPRAN